MKNSKPKKVYISTKLMVCPRCGCQTKHSLFDSEKGIYNCFYGFYTGFYSVWKGM